MIVRMRELSGDDQMLARFIDGAVDMLPELPRVSGLERSVYSRTGSRTVELLSAYTDQRTAEMGIGLFQRVKATLVRFGVTLDSSFVRDEVSLFSLSRNSGEEPIIDGGVKGLRVVISGAKSVLGAFKNIWLSDEQEILDIPGFIEIIITASGPHSHTITIFCESKAGIGEFEDHFEQCLRQAEQTGLPIEALERRHMDVPGYLWVPS